jgi:hypothetical protein
MSHTAEFTTSSAVSTFVPSFGQEVFALLPTGHHVRAIVAGFPVTGGVVLSIQGKFNPMPHPLGWLPCVSMSALRPIPAKEVKQVKAIKVAEAQKTVEVEKPKETPQSLSEEEFPLLPKTAQVTKVIAAPKATQKEAKVEVSSQELETEAAKLVSLEAAIALSRRNIRTMLDCTTHEQVWADFTCPAFAWVGEKRASVPFALSKNSAQVRKELIEKLGGVPEGTLIKFTYNFKRAEDGKLLDEKGNVRVFLKW